jgi:hypothetical protein
MDRGPIQISVKIDGTVLNSKFLPKYTEYVMIPVVSFCIEERNSV